MKERWQVYQWGLIVMVQDAPVTLKTGDLHAHFPRIVSRQNYLKSYFNCQAFDRLR